MDGRKVGNTTADSADYGITVVENIREAGGRVVGYMLRNAERVKVILFGAGDCDNLVVLGEELLDEVAGEFADCNNGNFHGGCGWEVRWIGERLWWCRLFAVAGHFELIFKLIFVPYSCALIIVFEVGHLGVDLINQCEGCSPN